MSAPVQKKFEVIRIGVGAIMAKRDYAVADLTFGGQQRGPCR